MRLWHKDRSLHGVDCVVLPGGFSYGDYLRAGALARFSPVMESVVALRARRRPGDRHLQRLPDPVRGRPAARRADPQPRPQLRLHGDVRVRVEETDTPFTRGYSPGRGAAPADQARRRLLRRRRAHAQELETTARCVLRYVDAAGRATEEANPNGSLRNIAGIVNATRNVFGLMPHPEHACEALLGGADGASSSAPCVDRAPTGAGRAAGAPAVGAAGTRDGDDTTAAARSPQPRPPSTAHARRSSSASAPPSAACRTSSSSACCSVMWSEHCSYKSSRAVLRELPTPARACCRGRARTPARSAIGDGLAVVFKIESHNHPSYVEPYQGAATGVGGILRDVFTMGARPIANLNSLRFGSFDHPRTRYLVGGVVARHRRLRQLRRRADRRRRDLLRPRLQREHPGQRLHPRRGARRPDLPRHAPPASATR